ncbi:Arc family DNA binding domain-containing protein [Parafilimonas sp.]|uniref:Arc family DNA binding domain-containing protein n=1 Tax=Parafilimonas sp. TaxID=1969739 RepID=UPI0039E37DD9
MSDKKSFILRIDTGTYALLEKWASDDFRSVNGQIEFLINNALIKAGRKAKGKTATNTTDKKK